MKKLFFLFLLSISFLNLATTASKSMTQDDAAEKISEEKSTDQIDTVAVEKLTKQFKELGKVIQKESLPTKTELTKVQTIYNKLATIAPKIKATFNYVSNNIDAILTKKGLIKTFLILGPLFTLYCAFFPPEPVKALIAIIFSYSSKGAVNIGTSASKGMVEGILLGIKDNWWQVLEVGFLTSLGIGLVVAPIQIIPIIIKLTLNKLGIPADMLK